VFTSVEHWPCDVMTLTHTDSLAVVESTEHAQTDWLTDFRRQKLPTSTIQRSTYNERREQPTPHGSWNSVTPARLHRRNAVNTQL